MSLILDPKHGVNPTITQCFICGEAKNEIILTGRKAKQIFGTEKAPMQACVNKVPCDKCKGYMKQGIILISVRNGTEQENPYRTGGWCVVKEEMMLRVFKKEAPLFKSRVAFIEDEMWDKLGLPRE